MNTREFIRRLQQGSLDSQLSMLYGTDEAVLVEQKERYQSAVESFEKLYPGSEEISVFSAPGRTEICGNHTDHQHGCVLAAAVNLDAIAIVSFHKDHVIRMQSVGYAQEYIELDDVTMRPEEKGTTTALIRGIVAQFEEMGVQVGGLNAFVTSDVLGGSGLSSSAAFEVLLGTIIDQHYNEGRAGAVNIAKMGQHVENHYFGKQSGLMDQMVSAVGGFVFIDFADTVNPEIQKYTCDFSKGNLQLFVTDTKGSHADLTDDYVSVPYEMNLVAAYFGKPFLREVDADQFYAEIPQLRTVCPDRAILRATHYFMEQSRVSQAVSALEHKEFDSFLKVIRDSGNSSATLLQNLYSTRKPAEQGIPLALMESERILQNQGACRVHGGGFAGTIQAFVPCELAERYCAEMNRLFGEGCCYKLAIRPVGGIQIV